MENKRIKLILNTINFLLKSENTVFITNDRVNNFFIIYRTQKGIWNFIMFDEDSKEVDVFPSIGRLEISFKKSISKRFALLFCGSYSTIDGLICLLSDYDNEPIDYDFICKFDTVSFKKIVRISERLEEKTLLHLLQYQSIEY